jgi:hypothetical protein
MAEERGEREQASQALARSIRSASWLTVRFLNGNVA